MEYFRLEPEVPGELLDATILDHSVHPSGVENLTVSLEGWLGGHILEIFPCFIVSDQVKHQLEKASATGCRFQQFFYVFGEHAPAEMKQQTFWHMLLEDFTTTPLDFSKDKDGYLVASSRGLFMLKGVDLSSCDIHPEGSSGPL